MNVRKLALHAERLAELTHEELVEVAGAASVPGCLTQGLPCRPSDHLQSACCYSEWC